RRSLCAQSGAPPVGAVALDVDDPPSLPPVAVKAAREPALNASPGWPKARETESFIPCMTDAAPADAMPAAPTAAPRMPDWPDAALLKVQAALAPPAMEAPALTADCPADATARVPPAARAPAPRIAAPAPAVVATAAPA